MALTPAQRQALAQAERQQRLAIKTKLTDFSTQLWGSLPSWRDAEIDRFVELLLPRIRAGEIATAQLTSAYLATLTDTPNTPLIDLSQIRPGITATEVYRRPATTLYTELALGKPFFVAMQIATNRLTSLVATDLQLAMTHQAQASLASSPYSMYRRTIGGNKTCALCVIASTQRYHKKNLLPIHPGCSCGVEPWEGEDAITIDPDLLESTHELIEQKLGTYDPGARNAGRDKTTSAGKPISDYTDLIVTRDHGEYGPTLTWRTDRFTGPSLIPTSHP